MKTKKRAIKDEILTDLVEIRGKILTLGGSLTPDKHDPIFLGTWSVKDLLAHLAGWDYTNIEAIQEILEGEVPDFYDYHDHDWRTFNERLIRAYLREDFDDLVTLVKTSHLELVDFLKTIPSDEYEKDRGLHVRGYKITISRLIMAEIKDENKHYQQIEEFIRGIHE